MTNSMRRAGQTSKADIKKAIAAKCKDCIYDPLEKGTHIDQITACRCILCPLYDLRPNKGFSTPRATSSETQLDINHQFNERQEDI